MFTYLEWLIGTEGGIDNVQIKSCAVLHSRESRVLRKPIRNVLRTTTSHRNLAIVSTCKRNVTREGISQYTDNLRYIVNVSD